MRSRQSQKTESYGVKEFLLSISNTKMLTDNLDNIDSKKSKER